MSVGTSYQQLLDAVASYYGTGSDQWVAIAQYGLQADNAAQILAQTPNVSTIVSKSGNVISYTVDGVASTAAQGAAATINSNTQTALMTQTTKLKIPANTTVAQTGEVVATSGAKTAATGATVTSTLGTVACAVGAVAAGIQLGATIDSTLYNLNPNFWDSNGLSSINPQNWDNVCSTQGGKDVFNMLFGVNKTTGETQPYMDVNAFAQVAQYLATQGVFDLDSKAQPPAAVTNVVPNMPDLMVYTDLVVTEPVSHYINYYHFNRPVAVVKFNDDTYTTWNIYITGTSANEFVGTKTYGPTGTERTQDLYTINATATTGNLTCYYNTSFSGDKGNKYKINVPVQVLPFKNTTPNFNATLNTIQYGNITPAGGTQGITPQDGATTPSGIDSEMTIQEVINQLQTLYPDLFNRAITNDVIQPDGTVKQYTYIPVGFPDDITGKSPTGNLQPIGGTGTTQNDDTIDDDSLEDLLQTLIDLLTTPDPDNPDDKPDPDDYPDTGDGDTPPIVTPTGSASALYKIYNPSQAQLDSFGAWLWSNDFVEQIKKIFNDPMQAIIGLHKVFAAPSTSGTESIKVGYLNSGVAANVVSNQYTSIDCGTVNLYEYFGNALDYLNTDIYIYLPFVGIVRLDTVDVMRGAINVTYKVDVLTGACLCSINVTRDMSGGQLYTYSGNCAVQYPLSSGSYMGIVASVLSIAGSVAGTIATGGAMLPVALGLGAGAIGGMRTQVEKSGSIGGNSGAMGVKKPYIIIRRPQTAIADNFDEFNGVSQNIYGKLSSYTGYTRIKYVNLKNITKATGEELTEIKNLLKDGVII